MNMKKWILTASTIAIIFSPLRADAPADGIERQIVQEINRARANPPGIADELEALRPLYRGKQRALAENLFLDTQEGVAAVDDAIAALRRTPARGPLRWDQALAQSAAELAQAESRSGAYGHGRGANAFAPRIRRHKRRFHEVGEDISYGSQTARDVVQGLIIDDGVADRGHRKNILDRQFDAAGAACAEHEQLSPACVIDFSGG